MDECFVDVIDNAHEGGRARELRLRKLGKLYKVNVSEFYAGSAEVEAVLIWFNKKLMAEGLADEHTDVVISASVSFLSSCMFESCFASRC